MGRDTRIQLIRKLEEIRGSHVLAYLTADRHPFLSQIAEDAVRPLYQQLLKLTGTDQPKPTRIDLFLYSRGGDVSVPWRVATMIREFCDEFNVLVPYKAHSAATMICLGADRIGMGRKSELGPIDPTLTRAAGDSEGTVPPSTISVEDVSSYISFMRERANINDQSALAQVVGQLASYLTPLALGSVNRQYSHIRLVARKLLASRNTKIDEDRIGTIIEALTEKIYSHGHAIGRREAAELGLPVEPLTGEAEQLVWQLYEEYEAFLKLNEPIDPEELLTLQNQEEHTEGNVALAAIESVQRLDAFEVTATFRRRRAVPPNPQINVNLTLGLPAGTQPDQLPAQVQQVLQQLVQQVSQLIGPAIQAEIVRQSPVVGLEVRTFGGKWLDRTNQTN
jgi:serine dehydrogenase proteinase